MFNDFPIFLHDTYEFTGNALRPQEQSSYLCELRLSPSSLEIKTTGIIGKKGDWDPQLIQGDIRLPMSSKNLSYHFFAYNNKSKCGGSDFRSNLTVNIHTPEFVILSPDCLSSIEVQGFSLQYNDLEDYIGWTTVQREFLESKDPWEPPKNPFEMCVSNETSQFSIGYEWSAGGSIIEKSTKLIPCIRVSYKEARGMDDVILAIKEFISLFSFLKGNINTPKMVILHLKSHPYGKKAFLYFSTAALKDLHDRGCYFLPLSKNDIFPHFPETPDVVFLNFLNNEKNIRWKISRLTKGFFYSYSEERFLNAFRIVEMFLFCFNMPYLTDEKWAIAKEKFTEILKNDFSMECKNIKGFIAAISKRANVKTSFLSCFMNWMKSNDEFCKALGISYSIMESLANYRNDITHGRDVSISDDEMLFSIIRLEIISIYCILKELGYLDEHLLSTVSRWPGYGRVSPRRDE